MGGNTSYPAHGMSHDDYCLKLKTENKTSFLTSDDKQSIDKKFGELKQIGKLYWFDAERLNLKQWNFLQNPLTDEITLKIREDYYLCLMADAIYKEFTTIDEDHHIKICQGMEFKKNIKKEFFSQNVTGFHPYIKNRIKRAN